VSQAGKKYVDATRKFDRDRLYTPAEAFDLVKSLAKRNFDETVEITFRLGIDPRKADQMIRGTVSLPHGTGKAVRVAVFATGDAAREAQEAGADVVGTDDLVARVQEGFLDFDVAIATPDLMSQVGRLGRVDRWRQNDPQQNGECEGAHGRLPERHARSYRRLRCAFQPRAAAADTSSISPFAEMLQPLRPDPPRGPSV